MGDGIKELSLYRFQRAYEDYETAQLLLKSRNLKASVKRIFEDVGFCIPFTGKSGL